MAKTSVSHDNSVLASQKTTNRTGRRDLPSPKAQPQPPFAPLLATEGWFSNIVKKLNPGRQLDGQRSSADPKFGNEQQPQSTPVQPESEENLAAMIMELIMVHEDWTARGTAIKISDLPTFDNLVDYEIEEKHARRLWKLEAERLVQAVETQCKGLRFECHEFLKECSQENYSSLSLLADQVLSISMICTHDNEVLLEGHCGRLHSKSTLDKCRSSLRRVVGWMGKLEERNHDAFFSLVNYITAICACNLSRSPNYSAYRNKCIASLARWSAKVKVLSDDPAKNAGISLALGQTKRVTQSGTIYHPTSDDHGFGVYGGRPLEGFVALPEKHKFLRTHGDYHDNISPSVKVWLETLVEAEPEIEGKAETTNTNGPEIRNAKTQYFAEQQMTRAHLDPILRFILLALKHHKLSGRTVSDFELCSCIYETGFEGFGASLFEDRDGEFLASSDLACLRVAQMAFETVEMSVKNLEEARRFEPSRPKDPHAYAEVQWAIGHQDGPALVQKRFQFLTRIADIVTVIVPLMMTSPYVTIDVVEFSRMMALTVDQDLPNTRDKVHNFSAFLSISTSEFQASIRSSIYDDVSPLSKGHMTRDRPLSGSRVAEIRKTIRDLPTEAAEANAYRLNSRQINADRIKEANSKMDEWIFDEKVVIVRCGGYVWTWTICALFFVIGGLVIGFSLGNRIRGVDPFNITTYCWVLAAFILLVARSLLVENWPWRDFLRGRVACRSVTELHAVTGIHEQLIIAKLLHDEASTILTTRGPFNSIFERRADDGLSIDVPTSMWTLLLSGLILLKVATRQGSALICLDARKGTRYATVFHRSNTFDPGNMLVCVDPETPRKSPWEGKREEKSHLLMLTRRNIQWTKVLGLYNKRNAEFL